MVINAVFSLMAAPCIFGIAFAIAKGDAASAVLLAVCLGGAIAWWFIAKAQAQSEE